MRPPKFKNLGGAKKLKSCCPFSQIAQDIRYRGPSQWNAQLENGDFYLFHAKIQNRRCNESPKPQARHRLISPTPHANKCRAPKQPERQRHRSQRRARRCHRTPGRRRPHHPRRHRQEKTRTRSHTRPRARESPRQRLPVAPRSPSPQPVSAEAGTVPPSPDAEARRAKKARIATSHRQGDVTIRPILGFSIAQSCSQSFISEIV